MTKYIFLTNQYLPRPGATGLCIHNIAKELAKRGNDVTTICYGSKSGLANADGVKIVRVKEPNYISSDGSVATHFQRLIEIVCKFIHLRHYPLRSLSLVKRYEKEIKLLLACKEKSCFKIIASYTPIEAVIAVSRLKKKYDFESYYYSADTISNEKGDEGLLPLSIRKKMGLKWEKIFFSIFDHIFVMECHEKYYKSCKFAPFRNKMITVNFPLLSANSKKQIANNKKYKIIVYAGTLYKELRNPESICRIFTQLEEKIDCSLIFMGDGDCGDILEYYERLSCGRIKYIGMQTHERVIEYISKADVLLSIGNKNTPMAPSKIYEYMSTGKPIIHFYVEENDPCLLPLKKYKNSFFIKEDSSFEETELVKFIMNGIVLDFESIKNIFLTSQPEYTANFLEYNISKNLGKGVNKRG